MTTKEDVQIMESEVDKHTLNGVRKGWLEPQGISPAEYLELPYEERKDIKLKITELGKANVGSDDFMDFLQKVPKPDPLIMDVKINEQTGEIQLKLTEEGVKARVMAEAMGLDFTKHLKNMMTDGLRKQLSEFIILHKDQKDMDGNTRIANEPGYQLDDNLIKKLKKEKIVTSSPP